MRTRLGISYIIRFILLIGIATAHAQTIQDTQNLMDALLTGYNRDIRPTENQGQPAIVNITFELVGVQEFDEVSETFTTIGVMNLVWVDPRMTWNPLLYNNTYTINLRKNNVWVPDLILSNPKESVKVLADRQDWMTVRYLYNGIAYWSPGDVFDSTCTVDVSYYPFDVQVCEMMFLPWGNSPDEVYLVSGHNTVYQSFFSENGEWKFKSSRTYASVSEGAFSAFTVEITIERRAAFFLVNVVIPIIFMSFLNVLVFWVPAESGERVSYGITVLLAIAVFLTIVGDNMPKTSEPMSILSYFLIINLVLSSLICVGAIFNLNIYFTHWERPVPKWLDSFTRFMICKKTIKKTPVEDIVDQLDAELVTPKTEQKFDKKKTEKWAKAVGEITGCVTRDCKPVTWREVSYAIDKVFGTIAILWLVISSTCFIVMMATHHSPSLG